ncbi:MAG: glycoside hydrolase family 97 protein [Candidatus Eisenbacteria bacterium]
MKQREARSAVGLITGVLVTAMIGLAMPSGECAPRKPGEIAVHSPDQRLEVSFDVVEGRPHYGVTYNGVEVIAPSSLGLAFRREQPMDRDFAIDDVRRAGSDETWTPVWGQSSKIRSNYNELTVNLIEKVPPNRRLSIIFRVFDDGLGFRYHLPEQAGMKDFEIMSEDTRFSFTGNHTTWWIPADFDSYEHLYTKSSLADVQAVNTPVTMKTADGIYISIHEANLTDYAGMTLARLGNPSHPPTAPHVLKSSLVPWPDGSKVKATTPLSTPWRTIQITTWPGGLVESNLILNLNEPCVIDDTSWIKPVKYIGIWWGMHIGKYTWDAGPRHGATTENAMRHIDFASRHGIPAVLIEGWNTGWDRWGQQGAYDYVTPYPDFDLEGVVEYARKQGVSLVGHHETGGDVPGYETQIDAAFSLYEKLGVPAVKTGYAGKIYPRGQYHHGQWMVNHYRMVVEKAARHRLMLDVHEPIKPTGISRTYPHMMTREGVRGTEFNAWSDGNPPEHTTILPFTRMLAGPLDYTPGIFDLTFDEYKKENRVRSTLANQLALFVVLYSPLQMAADLPENYEDNPAFEFIEKVPVDWDETRVLNGEIGDFVTIARRHGESWYIGSITDEDQRTLTLQLSFLDSDTTYTARIFADAEDADWDENPAAISIRDEAVTSDTILTVGLAPGGGQAIIIYPAE